MGACTSHLTTGGALHATAIGEGGEPVYAGCDLNLQIHPRNDDEQDEAMRLCDARQRRGCSPVTQGRPPEASWAAERRT